MNDSPILLHHQGPVSTIRFNRPEAMNAINSEMAAAFLSACQEVAARRQTRVLVLTGEGRGFMAGGDIAQFRDTPDSVVPDLIEPMNQAMLLLSELDVPVVASVQGAVAGAGMSIALACDIVIAASNTNFNFAYLKLGASCDLGASWHLPRLVGLRTALEIALLNEPIDATQALTLGLVNKVVPSSQLASVTECLVGRLSRSAPVAQGQLKRLMRQSFARDLDHQLEAEKIGFSRCMDSPDFQEAVSAFLEKRQANFGGH
ncbi:enoyl-CoA hydratase/isomerase family protein [Stutzerimonas tarimensis]|uniref:Enoyl-CoA hydratase/isomerase family protein n=1 Tax=Stutzerimonas tarimensis TaxID=1507735 RepID=A0ABV7TBT9_9GAMM